MQDQRPGRRLAIPIGVLALILFGFVSFKHSLHGINSDAAVYVLLADFYSPYRDHGISFIDHLFEHYPFPPLYPLLLGLLGGGTTEPILNYAVGAGLLAASLVLIFVWIRAQGGDLIQASAVPVLIALTPSAMFIAMGVYSEPFYLLLSFAGFIAVSHPHSRFRWYAAAALFGLSALARSVGIFAIASFIIYWLLQTRGRRYRMVPLIALCLPACWSSLKWLRNWHGSYVGSIIEDGPRAALENIAEQTPVNLEAIGFHFVRTFDVLGSAYVKAALVVLMVPACVSFIRRLRDAEMDALYVGIYLTVIAFWPYPNHMQRFLLMILPFFITYTLWGTAELQRFSTSKLSARCARWGAVALFALITMPSTLFITTQIHQYAGTPHADKTKSPDWYGRDSQAESLAAIDYRDRILAAIETVETHVPEDACVTSTMPEIVQLHARRKSLRPPLAEPDLDALIEHVSACSYVLMVNTFSFPPSYSYYYPLTELRAHLKLIHSIAMDPAEADGEALLLLARYVRSEQDGIAK